MSELKQPSEHIQESEIKFYDAKKDQFNTSSNQQD
jgi:hypothetical protein